MAWERLVALEHIIPIQDRQARRFDHPIDPAFFGRVEWQGRRGLSAIDKLGHQGLAIGGRQRARRIAIVGFFDLSLVKQMIDVANHNGGLLAHGSSCF